MIPLLFLACVVHACVNLVPLLSLTCVFPGVIVVLSLAFPFPDNHGVMGFFCAVEIDFWMVLKLSGGVSGKFPKA